MDQDREQLRLLAVFHWVVAGIAALCSLFPLIYLAMGIAMISIPQTGKQNNQFNEVMGWFFIVFSIGLMAAGIAFAVCLAIAGRSLSERRRYRYCLVMAGIACAFMPFGTVLGVFTIIVLMRNSVRESFGVEMVAQGSPARRAS